MAFKKALIERALGAETGHHLGYATGTERPPEATNQRNGRSAKTVLTDDGPLALQIPRDRDASFEPIPIPKTRATLHGVRRQDHRDVCPGHDGTRYPGFFA